MAHDRSPHKEKKKPKKHHDEPHGAVAQHRPEMALLHPRVPGPTDQAASRADAKNRKYEPPVKG